MRLLDKMLLVAILGCASALSLLLAVALDAPTSNDSAARNTARAGEEIARDAEAPEMRGGAAEEKGAAGAKDAGEAGRQAQDPDAGDPASYLLCSPEASLSRLVDARMRHAVAADEAGHLVFYGGAAGDSGTLTSDSHEILTGCLPQLAYTNHATVLIEGRGPEAAGPATLRQETRRTAGDALLTSFSFAGGARLDQRLSLHEGSLRVDYTLVNGSRARTSVSLRALVTPTADLGPSRDGRVPRFFVDRAGGGRREPVETETEIDGADVEAVDVPRTGAASDPSGRLLFAAEGRRPNILAFASTLDMTAARFRYAPATRSSAWPLPPMSTTAVYWLYEDIPAGGSSTFSYRYEPAPPERASRKGAR